MATQETNPPPSGLADQIRAGVLAVLGYTRARLELAGLEGKQALAQVGVVLLLVATAMTLALAGYLLLCLSVVFGLASLSKSQNAWILIAFVVGAMHVGGAWLVFRWAKFCLQEPMFASTLAEFKKDETWLKSTAAKPR
jgi:uncharacterized membrane protein YqjE